VSEVKISAEPRTEFGKGGARRTRRAGKVPAVLYGHGEAPRHIALPAREFAAAIRHGGKNQIFNIEITGGGTALALPKAIQKDPIKDTFDHVDLLVVRRGEKVTVEIPVQLVGDAARDTLVMTESNTLAVLADATKLPEHLEASIDGLEAGSRVTAADIKLPAGVELAADPELVIAIISAEQAQVLESEGGETEAAAEEPAPADAEA
jgi:large subunit ribosomal protein L25